MEVLKELFRLRRYKASQGKLIRKLTMAGIWVIFATAAWKCTLMDFTWLAGRFTWLAGWDAQLKTATESNAVDTIVALSTQIQTFVATFVVAFPYSMAGVTLLCGLWFGYRLVHWTTFADFLISVEGEMAKVSWPSKGELRSATFVVLTLFFLLAGVLYAYDLVFVLLFRIIGVVV